MTPDLPLISHGSQSAAQGAHAQAAEGATQAQGQGKVLMRIQGCPLDGRGKEFLVDPPMPHDVIVTNPRQLVQCGPASLLVEVGTLSKVLEGSREMQVRPTMRGRASPSLISGWQLGISKEARGWPNLQPQELAALLEVCKVNDIIEWLW